MYVFGVGFYWFSYLSYKLFLPWQKLSLCRIFGAVFCVQELQVRNLSTEILRRKWRKKTESKELVWRKGKSKILNLATSAPSSKKVYKEQTYSASDNETGRVYYSPPFKTRFSISMHICGLSTHTFLHFKIEKHTKNLFDRGRCTLQWQRWSANSMHG